jgi:chromosome segregation ATPase
LAQQKQLKFISNLKNNNEIEQTTADEEFQKLVAQIEALKNEMSQSEKELKDKHEQELRNFESINKQKIESLETKMRSLESEKTNLLTQLEQTESKLKEETIAKNQNEETTAKLAAQIEENKKKSQEALHQQPQQNESPCNSHLDQSFAIAKLHRYFLLHSKNILKPKPFFSNIKHKTLSKGCTYVDSNGVQCNGNGNTNKNSKTHRTLNHCPNFKLAELFSKETKQNNQLKENKSKLREETNQNKEDKEFPKLVDQIDSLKSKLKAVTTAHGNRLFNNSLIFANQGEIEKKLSDQEQQISSLNRQIQAWMHSYGILNDECLKYKIELDNSTQVKFLLSFTSLL